LAKEKREALIKRKPWNLRDYRMGSAFKYDADQNKRVQRRKVAPRGVDGRPIGHG